MLPRVIVTIPRAFVKALIKPRDLNYRPREFDFSVRQLTRLMRARPLVIVLGNLHKHGAVERAGPVLALEIEMVEHAALLVHENHQLDPARIKDPEGLQTEVLSSSTLFTKNSSFLSERQRHRGCM